MVRQGLDDFKELYINAKKFFDNLAKESIERRGKLERINKLLADHSLFESKISSLKFDISEVNFEEAESLAINNYIKNIDELLSKSKQILLERLYLITEKVQPQVDATNLTMASNFDIKAASSLLPCLDNSEDTTNQLIDSIQLYSQLLNDEGKKFLINFVLKTRLTQSAKLRLANTYSSVENLINDIKRHLLTKKSAAALATDLHTLKQSDKTIEEYAKKIEDLFINLTLAQADGDENKIPILKEVNEKLAINSFSNGLKNGELRTIVKARNYASLKDAIVGAKDEERLRQSNSSSSQSAFNIRHKNNNNNFRRGCYRGRFGNNFNRGLTQNNFNRGAARFINNYNPRGNLNNVNSRNRGSNQGRGNYRGQQNRNLYHRNYFTDLDNENPRDPTNVTENRNADERFFRS